MPLLALAPWMESLAIVLIGFLADAVVGLLGKVLVGLGIGVVTTTGFNALLSGALGYMTFQGLGNAQFDAAITSVGIPWFVSTLVSAVTTKLALSGLKSDAVSAWRVRKAA